MRRETTTKFARGSLHAGGEDDFRYNEKDACDSAAIYTMNHEDEQNRAAR